MFVVRSLLLNKLFFLLLLITTQISNRYFLEQTQIQAPTKKLQNQNDDDELGGLQKKNHIYA